MSNIISVVVPIYNAEKYLRASLDSILRQSFTDIEIICVNDGSTDETLNILNEYSNKDKRIKIINQENRGRSSARNAGMAVAKGKYLMFCDADDIYDQNMCKIMYEGIKNNKVSIACCEISVNYECDQHLSESDSEYYSLKFEGKKECSEEDLLKIDGSVCNKIFKMELINKYNIKFPDGLVYEDAAFFFMYYSVCKNGYFIKKPLYFYTRHYGSIMNETFKGSEKAIDHIKIMDIVYNHLKDNNLWDVYKKVFFNAYVLYFDAAYRYSLVNQKRNIFNYAIKFLKQFDINEYDCLPEYIKNSIKLILNRSYGKEKDNLNFWQKIFSVTNTYKKGHKFKCIVLFGIKLMIKIKPKSGTCLKDKLNLVKYYYRLFSARLYSAIKIKQILVKSRFKKIRVLFYVTENQKWGYQSVYDAFLADKRFDPFVVVSILDGVHRGIDNTRNNLEENYQFFKSRGINVKYGYQNNRFINLKDFNPDIVFYEQPWELPRTHRPYKVYKYALTCHCSYAFELFENGFSLHKNFYDLLYRFYQPHELSIKTIERKLKRKVKNCEVVGYPKLDIYRNVEIKQDFWKQQNKIKIIYAPHHSFEENGLMLATFRENGRLILDWAKNHPETTWIFKPHPRFKFALLSNGIMTNEEIEQYYKEWESIGRVYTLGDYFDIFNTSDLMITDCGSFLAEYLPTQKPIIRPVNAKGADFNDVGQHLVSAYYQTKSNEELLKIMEEVIINKNDYAKVSRLNVISEFFDFNESSADKIRKSLLKEFKLKEFNNENKMFSKSN